MQLDIGGRGGGGRARQWSGVPDADQLVAEPGAVVDRRDVERALQRHAADVDEAAEHVRREAGALLVGEEGDGDRQAGLHAVLLEGLDDLEPGQHAQVAVEAAPGGDGVDVRAGHHGCGGGVGALAGGDDVADRVDRDVEPEIPHPADDEVAPVAVGIGEREAGRAVLAVGSLDRPDLAERHDARPQAVTVDAQARSQSARRPAELVPGTRTRLISPSASQNASTAPANSSAPRSASHPSGRRSRRRR